MQPQPCCSRRIKPWACMQKSSTSSPEMDFRGNISAKYRMFAKNWLDVVQPIAKVDDYCLKIDSLLLPELRSLRSI